MTDFVSNFVRLSKTNSQMFSLLCSWLPVVAQRNGALFLLVYCPIAANYGAVFSDFQVVWFAIQPYFCCNSKIQPYFWYRIATVVHAPKLGAKSA